MKKPNIFRMIISGETVFYGAEGERRSSQAKVPEWDEAL